MLNKLLSLCGVMFLIIPFPLAIADEVWEWERFEDNTFESAITISNDPSIYCNEQDQYGTTGCSLALDNGTYTFTFSTDIQVYEVAFLVGAVNNSYSVTWYYADNTNETENKSGQNSSDFSTMYDDFYKSFTDHNAVEENIDKYITAFDVTLTDISLLDSLYWQYDDATATGNFATTTTTTSSTTTTTTTTSTTTTTTTIPPKPEPEPEPEPYVEPEPLPPPPEEIIVDIVVEGVDKTYTQADVNDGTIERDQERIDNEAAYGCFMTDAQIDRGDCIIIKEEVIDEEIIIEDKENVEIVIPEDVVEIFDAPEEKEIEIEILEFEEQPIEFEVIEFDLEDVAPKDVVEIPIQDEIIEDIIEDELDETLSIDDEIREDEIQVENNDDKIIQEIVESEEEIELIEVEEAIKEIVKVEEIIELKNEEELNTLSQEEVVIYEEEVKAAIVEYVEDLDQEDQIEVIKEVTDIGITNLNKATKETKQVVQAVVNEVTKVENVETLTQEQTEVVADILGFEETEDVAIIAEAAAKEENIAQAVDEYVERASDNANVENYNLSDVVVEIAVENFIADPISIIQIDFNEITINNLSSGMTSSQKEKAQEVVVPVILARIATIGSFIMRKSF